MMAELMGWKNVMKDYVPEEGTQDCGWLEEGIDEDLYFFHSSRETCEFYNSINSVTFELPWTRMIYEKLSVRSECEAYYQTDMALMREAGYIKE